jgi:hypothetical protein
LRCFLFDLVRRRRIHPPLSPARPAERLPPHPPLRPVRRHGSRAQHRARTPSARRVQGLARERARRGRQRERKRFACAPLPMLRRPDDHRRDVRGPASWALAAAEPDQDRHLMTVAPHPASHHRSLSPQAARRNTNAMPTRRPQSSFDQSEPLAPAHRRHPRGRPSALPPKIPTATGRQRLARRPSAILKFP